MRHGPGVGQAPGEALARADEDNLDTARRLIGRLDRSILPIQGPPRLGEDLHRRAHDSRSAQKGQARHHGDESQGDFEPAGRGVRRGD